MLNVTESQNAALYFYK